MTRRLTRRRRARSRGTRSRSSRGRGSGRSSTQAPGAHSCHHQAPERIGDGLTVSARAADGVVEGLELGEHPFAVGVLWHPEEDPADGAALFRALVEAADEYRVSRAA